jgi:hypothetical protein
MNLLMRKQLFHPNAAACFPYPGGLWRIAAASLFSVGVTRTRQHCQCAEGVGVVSTACLRNVRSSARWGMSRDVPSLQPHNRSNGPPWPPRWRYATCAAAALHQGQDLNGVQPETVSNPFVSWLCGLRRRLMGMGDGEGLTTGRVSTLGMLGVLLPLSHTSSYLSAGTAVRGGVNLLFHCCCCVTFRRAIGTGNCVCICLHRKIDVRCLRS